MEWIKNDILIHYPKDDLHLHSSSSHQSSYTLYSVINHNGSLNDGHYTTFSRVISTNKEQWFDCDDENIKYSTSDQLDCNPKAYLLFYMMKETFE
jgi:ubiquitin carboxyl-terminal hydrolase 22/27/51